MTTRGEYRFLAFGGVGVLLIGAYLAVADTFVACTILYETASILGVAAVLFGLRDPRRRGSTAWRLLAMGIAGWAAGDLLWSMNALGAPLPWAHITDAIYVASYVPLAWSLLVISRQQQGEAEPLHRQLVDAGILFVAAYSAVWFLLIDPLLDRGGQPLLETVLAVAYPTLDLVLLALATRFAFATGRWSGAHRLITAAFAAMFVADLFWRLGVANSNYSLESWFNALYMVGYLCWGAAALHPSRLDGDTVTVDAATVYAGGRRRLLLLAAVAVTPTIIFVTSHASIDDLADYAIFAGAIALLPLFTLLRAADMLKALRRMNAAFDAIICSSPIPICVVEKDGSVVVWNTAAEATSGYAAGEVIGRPPPLFPLEDAERVALLYQQALAGLPHDRVEVKLAHREGHAVDVRVSTAPLNTADGRVVALFEDVTQLKQTAAQIEFLASHDSLTKLPNRRTFERDLEQAVARLARGEHTALLLCDIDNFKLVNDTAGHPVGDRFLIEVANRLRSRLRPTDTLARLSGDEFAILLAGTTETQAAPAVERLLEHIRDYRLESRAGVLDITLSVGVYQLREGETAERALRRADDALYEAKEHGKNQHRIWKPDNVAVLSAARGWSPRLKDALREDRLDAFLQPIVSLPGETLAFYEMLCRLRRSDGTYILPNAFLDHADRLGLMPAIDRRMLEHAEKLLAEHPDLHLLVNLSAASFDDAGLLDYLHTILKAVRPGSLGIEISERAALSDLARATTELQRDKRLGALIAIDDFGQGFTSFEHLRHLPADLVKIGNGFIQGLGNDPVDDAILDGIVSTARALSMRIVAEGVETRETARLLQVREIAYAQGYLYGRPSPIDQALQTSLREPTDKLPSRDELPGAYHLEAGGLTAHLTLQ